MDLEMENRNRKAKDLADLIITILHNQQVCQVGPRTTNAIHTTIRDNWLQLQCHHLLLTKVQSIKLSWTYRSRLTRFCSNTIWRTCSTMKRPVRISSWKVWYNISRWICQLWEASCRRPWIKSIWSFRWRRRSSGRRKSRGRRKRMIESNWRTMPTPFSSHKQRRTICSRGLSRNPGGRCWTRIDSSLWGRRWTDLEWAQQRLIYRTTRIQLLRTQPTWQRRQCWQITTEVQSLSHMSYQEDLKGANSTTDSATMPICKYKSRTSKESSGKFWSSKSKTRSCDDTESSRKTKWPRLSSKTSLKETIESKRRMEEDEARKTSMNNSEFFRMSQESQLITWPTQTICMKFSRHFLRSMMSSDQTWMPWWGCREARVTHPEEAQLLKQE